MKFRITNIQPKAWKEIEKYDPYPEENPINRNRPQNNTDYGISNKKNMKKAIQIL